MKIRYYGEVGQPTGYGVAADAMCRSLIEAGVELEIRPFSYQRMIGDDALLSRVRRDYELKAPDAIVIHTLPNDCARVAEIVPEITDDNIQKIAYTTWEACSGIPAEMARSFMPFDQVWTPSHSCTKLFGPVIDHAHATIHTVPHAFDMDTLELRRAPRSAMADDGTFKFYYVGAWNRRKNPEGLVQAFCNAFTPDDKVTLVMKTDVNDEEWLCTQARTGLLQHQLPKMVRNTKFVTTEALWGLHADADCFVTASHGEAWNLPAFDAMLAQRNVITPAGLGSDTFLRNTSAFRFWSKDAQNEYQAVEPAMIDATVTEIDRQGRANIRRVGAQGLDCRALWRRVDVLQLAETMRTVYQLQARCLSVYDGVAAYSYPEIGKKALSLLEHKQ